MMMWAAVPSSGNSQIHGGNVRGVCEQDTVCVTAKLSLKMVIGYHFLMVLLYHFQSFIYWDITYFYNKVCFAKAGARFIFNFMWLYS